MKCHRLLILLSGLFFLPALFAQNSNSSLEQKDACYGFLEIGDEEQERTYQNQKERFIQSLRLVNPLYQRRLFDLVDDYNDSEKQNIALGNFVEWYSNFHEFSNEGHKLLKQEVDALEVVADCHDFGEISGTKVMHFVFQKARKLEQFSSSQLLARPDNYYVGFLLPAERNDTDRMVRLTRAKECTDLPNCQFTDQKLSTIYDDLILLVHSGTQKLTFKDLDENEDELLIPDEEAIKPAPKRIFLKELDLKEHTERLGLTSPDLVMNVAYFRGNAEKPLRIETTPIPWVTRKGVNQALSLTEIIDWKKADRVALTLIEKNWNIPSYWLSFIFKEMFSAGKLALGYFTNSSELVQAGLAEMFTGGSSTFPTEGASKALSRFSKDQIIATVELTRWDKSTGEPSVPRTLDLTNDALQVQAELLLEYSYEEVDTLATSTEKTLADTKEPREEL